MTKKMNRVPSGCKQGFTLIEMLVVVAIVGVLSAVAIPILSTHQLRAKSSEVRTNLGAIQVAQDASFAETGLFLPADAEPPIVPGAIPADFDSVGSDYSGLGWAPEGRVYFSYAVEVSPDRSGFTADAAADLDADGVMQIWGYARPDASGTVVAGGLGCVPEQMTIGKTGPCHAGASIF
ncbi:MAG: prepilin-type N-terminal cleavage/methylation domain-containing protein [Myxococcota bacterium]|jgi:prepilin-type N-terminal cleavage/methylation domain-containing protein|nr:prepilin-type N-terminal cleavage/methylation domain-containing protein [Myxococcota bacterium]